MRLRHGPRCNARTYPTTCRRCRSRVFYFSCDCGSLVFFDNLGPRWSGHNCGHIGGGLHQIRQPSRGWKFGKDIGSRLSGTMLGDIWEDHKELVYTCIPMVFFTLLYILMQVFLG